MAVKFCLSGFNSNSLTNKRNVEFRMLEEYLT